MADDGAADNGTADDGTGFDGETDDDGAAVDEVPVFVACVVVVVDELFLRLYQDRFLVVGV